MENDFVLGQVYRRRDIHSQYGGQERGGISTPAELPFVFIFTGENGEQYGYEDGWASDDKYLYTGEGQLGDARCAGIREAVCSLEHSLEFACDQDAYPTLCRRIHTRLPIGARFSD